MKIAVTYQNGEIYQHFGHTEQFKVYDIADGKVVSSEIIDTNGSGHGALAGFLKDKNIDTLICGGIGGGAINALKAAGIDLYPGVNGNADACAAAFADGNLVFNPNTRCQDHDHSHGESCGHHHGESGGSCGSTTCS